MSPPSKIPPAAMTGIFLSKAVFIRFDRFQDLRQERLQRVVFRMAELFEGEAEMSPREGAFEDEGVGRSLETLGPATEDQFRGPGRANDGHEVHRSILDEFGELHRQSGPKDDHLDAFPDGGLDQVFNIAERAHEIDGENPLGHGSGLADLFLQGFPGDPFILMPGRFEIPQADARDGADSALLGHRRRQGCERHPHAHPSLDDRELCGEVSDMKLGDVHRYLPFSYLLTTRQAFPPPKPKDWLMAASSSIDSAPRVT